MQFRIICNLTDMWLSDMLNAYVYLQTKSCFSKVYGGMV